MLLEDRCCSPTAVWKAITREVSDACESMGTRNLAVTCHCSNADYTAASAGRCRGCGGAEGSGGVYRKLAAEDGQESPVRRARCGLAPATVVGEVLTLLQRRR